jgi:pimeloyl-ACP methyl ester carboxylesterase
MRGSRKNAFDVAMSEENHVSLVVVLHAFTFGPANMRPVCNAVRQAKENVHVITPALPLGLFSTADANQLASDLLECIEKQVQFRSSRGWDKFREIVFIGHSLGALIARKVYVLCCGTPDAPFEADAPWMSRRQWAGDVKRIVLLAGMNRGWSITHHLNIKTAIQLSIGGAFGHLLLSIFGARLVIFEVQRGSAFLTQLRLQWIALARHLDKEGLPMATTVQLLGTIDDLVSPDDNIDLETGRDFLYLDVPHSGHGNVIEFDDPEFGEERRTAFQEALVESVDALRQKSILPADPDLAQVRPDVTNVIFVIHGIRDAGYWTHKIARKVVAMGQSPPRIYASETSTYGYVQMIPFLLPSRRRQKVQWLMDQYVEAKFLYPKATFSYVGHSNGTYLLANALENYPACRFDNVVFAGSVVRKDFDWNAAIARGQVKSVLNYVATADRVVAWFPGALEELRLQDLGTAGHNGFLQARFENGDPGLPLPPIYERRYVRGGHGSALVEKNWDDIAHFVVNGKPQEKIHIEMADTRDWSVVCVGWIAPVVWVVLMGLVYLGATKVWSLPWPEWAKTSSIIVYAALIWRILTRF